MEGRLEVFDGISVLVIGDVMLDRYIWGHTRRISPEAPVPVVEVQRETHTAGGAANVALNLAALGVRCELCGMVGDDAAGAELRAMLETHGVAFDRALVRAEVPTITKARVVVQKQQVCRLDWEAAPAGYTLSRNGALEIVRGRAAEHHAVILSDYAKGTIDQRLVDALREVTGLRGALLAMDPKPKRPLDLRGFGLLTPNRGEAYEMAAVEGHGAGDCDVETVAARVMERFQPKHLVVTLSEEGMLLLEKEGRPQRFPTRAREVADVSGAGDTVIAVLTAALAGGLAASEAVHLANVAAGIVVGKLGTATVTREELARGLELEG